MSNSTSIPLVKTQQSIWAALAALLVTMWLFYIDEGYYDFRWMREAYNWIWFLVYAGGIWGVQMLAGKYLFKRYAAWEQVILNIVLGIPAGVILIISVFMLIARI
jgi:hypothetical protein